MTLPKRSKKRQTEIDSGAYQPPKRKPMKRTAFKKKTIAEMIAEGLVKKGYKVTITEDSERPKTLTRTPKRRA